jgi:hypothetical protein
MDVTAVTETAAACNETQSITRSQKKDEGRKKRSTKNNDL